MLDKHFPGHQALTSWGVANFQPTSTPIYVSNPHHSMSPTHICTTLCLQTTSTPLHVSRVNSFWKKWPLCRTTIVTATFTAGTGGSCSWVSLRLPFSLLTLQLPLSLQERLPLLQAFGSLLLRLRHVVLGLAIMGRGQDPFLSEPTSIKCRHTRVSFFWLFEGDAYHALGVTLEEEKEICDKTSHEL